MSKVAASAERAYAAIRVSEEESGTLVHVVGELDIASSRMLDEALRTVGQQSRGRIVVDLSRVTFMDSAGLRALVRARERMDARGRWLVTRGASGQPRRLLEIGRRRYGMTL